MDKNAYLHIVQINHRDQLADVINFINEAIFSSSVKTHHQLIFNSCVLCFIPHVNNLPQLAVRPTHVRFFES